MIKDPNILYSFINTKLRDSYSSLDELCEELDYDKDEIIEILSKINAKYNEELNQFQIE